MYRPFFFSDSQSLGPVFLVKEPLARLGSGFLLPFLKRRHGFPVGFLPCRCFRERSSQYFLHVVKNSLHDWKPLSTCLYKKKVRRNLYCTVHLLETNPFSQLSALPDANSRSRANGPLSPPSLWTISPSLPWHSWLLSSCLCRINQKENSTCGTNASLPAPT